MVRSVGTTASRKVTARQPLKFRLHRSEWLMSARKGSPLILNRSHASGYWYLHTISRTKFGLQIGDSKAENWHKSQMWVVLGKMGLTGNREVPKLTRVTHSQEAPYSRGLWEGQQSKITRLAAGGGIGNQSNNQCTQATRDCKGSIGNWN